MHKLVDRGIFDERREGMTKSFSLCSDWENRLESERGTMRSNGLFLQREIRDATEEYNFLSGLLQDATAEETPRLEQRQENALNRLMDAKGRANPELSAELHYADAMLCIDRLTGVAEGEPVQPVAANGLVVIPAGAIKKENKQKAFARGLAGDTLWIDSNADLLGAITYLIHERVGVDMEPAQSAQFLASLEKLGIGTEIDAMSSSEAIDYLQAMRAIEISPVQPVVAAGVLDTLTTEIASRPVQGTLDVPHA